MKTAYGGNSDHFGWLQDILSANKRLGNREVVRTSPHFVGTS